MLGFCNIIGDFVMVLKVCDKLFIIFLAHVQLQGPYTVLDQHFMGVIVEQLQVPSAMSGLHELHKPCMLVPLLL